MARNDLIKALFQAMRCELSVMAEHHDSDIDLLQELETADNDILMTYKELYFE